MSQELDNNIKPKINLQSFIKENSKKIILILSSVIISSIIFFFFSHQNEKKNILIAEKYVKAGIFLTSDKPEKAKELYEEIILSKNRFYSILALNKVIEKTLISDKNIILKYFNILENSISKGDQKDLIIFKKALFLIKNSDIEKGNELLNELIKDNSSLKSLAEEIVLK